MTFYISNLNPIRFTGGAGNKFDRLLMEDLINRFQDKKCYFQKWNIGDETKIQILSDYEFTFKIYDVDGAEYADLVPDVVSTNIIGKTFSVYEIELQFIEEGYYYAVIEYDGNTLISEAWQVGNFDDTVLYKYKNSENNFSVVFDTGIEMLFRVEGIVGEFEPKSDDVIYNDQLKNSRILNSVPWRSFQLYVGNEQGVPEWVADKVNRIMACDVVHIDSETFDGYISKVEGAEWEVNRVKEYAFIGLKTEIMHVENDLLERLKRGSETGENSIKVIQKVENYFLPVGTITVSGIFAKYRLLEKICIEKDLLTPNFTIKVGITNGGSEVGEFDVTETANTFTINHLFLGSTVVYITGITEEIPFLSVIYKNLIEVPVSLGAGESSGEIPVGFEGIYNGIEGRALTDDFDIITGLGRESTPWYGWSISNGLNGTKDRGGLFLLGYKDGEYEMDSVGGESEHILTIEEMPEHEHEHASAVGNIYKRGNTGTAFFQDGNIPANNKTTSPAGGGQAHNNMPPYQAVVYVTKIF
jgi:hypothetical protein